MLQNYYVSSHIPSQTFEYTRLEIMQALIHVGGFTYHEAHCIYQEHVAPLTYLKRVVFTSKVHTKQINVASKEGRALLNTSRGL